MVYNITLFGPGDTRVVYRRRDAVVHLQYGQSPARPWQGRAPWQASSLSGDLLAGIERQLAGEAGSSSGYVMPTPDVGDKGQGEDDPLTTLRRDLAAVTAGFGGGPGVARRGGRGQPTVATLARAVGSLVNAKPDERGLTVCGAPHHRGGPGRPSLRLVPDDEVVKDAGLAGPCSGRP